MSRKAEEKIIFLAIIIYHTLQTNIMKTKILLFALSALIIFNRVGAQKDSK